MKGSMLYLNFQSDPENIYIYIIGPLAETW